MFQFEDMIRGCWYELEVTVLEVVRASIDKQAQDHRVALKFCHILMKRCEQPIVQRISVCGLMIVYMLVSVLEG